jgi:hypothetical protein
MLVSVAICAGRIFHFLECRHRPGARSITLTMFMAIAMGMATMVAYSNTAEADVQPGRRSMWVWNTDKILASQAETNRLVNGAVSAGATDVFLYLTSQQYQSRFTALRQLIGALRRLGVTAWGMEGYRGYFSDVAGPAELYSAMDAMTAYNRKVVASERFAGFHVDMEPQDGQGIGPNAFTNGKPQSVLTAAERARRDALMADWVSIYTGVRSRTSAAGLRFGAAFPSWVDDYEGEAVTYVAGGVRKNVLDAMMALVDDYVVMSYNTDPANAANRVAGELARASALKATAGMHYPAMHASVETHRGVGPTISYGDHPVKNTKAAVVIDMDIIHKKLSSYPAFSGVAVHDWEGWRLLPPYDNDARMPGAAVTTQALSLTGWRPY